MTDFLQVLTVREHLPVSQGSRGVQCCYWAPAPQPLAWALRMNTVPLFICADKLVTWLTERPL